MKDDYEKLRGKVKKLKDTYNFRGLFHFTDFSNLNSIISIGYLCGRDICYANHIEFYDVCDEETIKNIPSKVKGCTRLYYVEKNNCEVMERLDIPVYLLFNEEILYNDLAIYTDGNADFSNTIYGTDYEFFNYDIDWKAIFNKKESSNCFKETVEESFECKRQSELLIDEPVPLNQLKNIIFRCNADYKRACNLFGKNKMFLVEPNIFYNDKNYILDYNIVYNPMVDSDIFILHFSSNEPVKTFEGHEYRLYDVNDKLIRKAKVNFSGSDNTDFHVEVGNLPELPIKFKFWFYKTLAIEETIG